MRIPLPAPKALACYGLLARWWAERTQRCAALGLRFVAGRPVSAVTIDFLGWWAQQAQARDKRAVVWC